MSRDTVPDVQIEPPEPNHCEPGTHVPDFKGGENTGDPVACQNCNSLGYVPELEWHNQ